MKPGAKSAVVLSGGGAYGAYEVGVLTALASGACASTGYRPLDPHVVAGTSVGAFNAAAFLAAPAEDPVFRAIQLQRLWLGKIANSPAHPTGGVIRLRGDPRGLLYGLRSGRVMEQLALFLGDLFALAGGSLSLALRFAASPGDLAHRAAALLDIRLLISAHPFVRLLRSVIDLSALRQSRRALRIISTNWQRGGARVFRNDDMTDLHGHAAIAASAAIPGIFNPQTIDGTQFVDGGLVMNTPLSPVIDAGADTVHLVSLNPGIGHAPSQSITGTVASIYRALAISLKASLDLDVRTATRLNEGMRQLAMAARRPGKGNDPRPGTLTAGSLALRPSSAPYRQITIHRYELANDEADFVGFLNFDRRRLVSLIARGMHDAAHHDCRTSGCTLAVD
jgi:NTE family protein